MRGVAMHCVHGASRHRNNFNKPVVPVLSRPVIGCLRDLLLRVWVNTSYLCFSCLSLVIPYGAETRKQRGDGPWTSVLERTFRFWTTLALLPFDGILPYPSLGQIHYLAFALRLMVRNSQLLSFPTPLGRRSIFTTRKAIDEHWRLSKARGDS